jgi:hypothetical protein
MAARVEVARGVIGMLTRRLRERMRDIADLRVRVQELERSTGAAQAGSTAGALNGIQPEVQP